MPQTRFVLGKAIELGLKPVVVINKVDKPNCTPEEVHEAVFDLMFALDATEDQLDFPVVYGSSKNGWMGADWKTPTEDVSYLLDVILEQIPAPKKVEGTAADAHHFSLTTASFQGRIAVGRVSRGSIKAGQQITLVKNDGWHREGPGQGIDGLRGPRQGESEVGSGLRRDRRADGLGELRHRRYRCRRENPEGLSKFKVDEPTMSMLFTINTSPFFGKEGEFVTSRHLRDRSSRRSRRTWPCGEGDRFSRISCWSSAGVSCTSASWWRPCAAKAMSSSWANPKCSIRTSTDSARAHRIAHRASAGAIQQQSDRQRDPPQRRDRQH
jgi:GTP-binding protein